MCWSFCIPSSSAPCKQFSLHFCRGQACRNVLTDLSDLIFFASDLGLCWWLSCFSILLRALLLSPDLPASCCGIPEALRGTELLLPLRPHLHRKALRRLPHTCTDGFLPSLGCSERPLAASHHRRPRKYLILCVGALLSGAARRIFTPCWSQRSDKNLKMLKHSQARKVKLLCAA